MRYSNGVYIAKRINDDDILAILDFSPIHEETYNRIISPGSLSDDDIYNSELRSYVYPPTNRQYFLVAVTGFKEYENERMPESLKLVRPFIVTKAINLLIRKAAIDLLENTEASNEINVVGIGYTGVGKNLMRSFDFVEIPGVLPHPLIHIRVAIQFTQCHFAHRGWVR